MITNRLLHPHFVMATVANALRKSRCQ